MPPEINNDFNFKTEEEKNDFFKTRVELLGLSARTQNALINGSIRTIGGIVRKAGSSLKDIGGLGSKGVEEIKRKLNDSFNIFISSISTEKHQEILPTFYLTTSVDEIQQFLKEPIQKLDLSKRTTNALENSNIRTVSGLIRKTANMLREIEGLGEKGVQEIKATLNSIFNFPNDKDIGEDGVVLSDRNLPDQNKLSDLIPALILKDRGDFITKFASYFNLEKKDIESPSRKKEIVSARNLIVYFLRDYGDMSFMDIGRLLGNRDHTTIIHSYKKIKDTTGLKEDFETRFASFIKEIELVNSEPSTGDIPLVPEIIKSIRSYIHNPFEPVSNLKFKEISNRNLKILELYKQGSTLKNIAKEAGITRERVRQIVDKTIRQTAINDSASKGITIDAEILIEEEKEKRRSLRRKTVIYPPLIKKAQRWCRYYLACKSCGTISIPHVKNGLCERCIGGFRADRREEIIQQHNNKCDLCECIRHEAITLYGRDFYITKDKEVFCRKCFLKKTGKGLGSYRNYEWSRHYEKCLKCGTTSIPHVKNGLCIKCSDFITNGQREEIVTKHGSRCDDCSLDRIKTKEKYGKDFYLTKNNGVLCMNCFQKYARNTMESANINKKTSHKYYKRSVI